MQLVVVGWRHRFWALTSHADWFFSCLPPSHRNLLISFNFLSGALENSLRQWAAVWCLDSYYKKKRRVVRGARFISDAADILNCFLIKFRTDIDSEASEFVSKTVARSDEAGMSFHYAWICKQTENRNISLRRREFHWFRNLERRCLCVEGERRRDDISMKLNDLLNENFMFSCFTTVLRLKKRFSRGSFANIRRRLQTETLKVVSAHTANRARVEMRVLLEKSLFLFCGIYFHASQT